MRDNKCLFRIKNKCNSGSTDSAETQIISQLQGEGKGFYEKWKGNNYLNRRNFYWC